MKILAIDDSPTLRKFISKHLATYSDSYEVTVAATGEEGVKAATSILPDLILLDFILPDFNGDEVCRRLLDEEKTAAIPVILMSSSAPDIEKNEDEFENITRSMVKPFSPQLLCASVSSVLKKAAAKTENQDAAALAEAVTAGAVPKEKTSESASASSTSSTPAKQEAILLCGKTSYFPFVDALLGLEAEKPTGILHMELPSGTHHAYFRSGLPVLVSTTHVDAYMLGGKLEIPEESQEYFDASKKKQQQSGHPLFLQMVKDEYLPAEQGKAFTDQYGNHLFAEIWTSLDAPFKFIVSEDLPDYVPEEPIKDSMLNWITTTLRCINTSSPAVQSIAKPEDTLSFTSAGYRKLQSFSLTEEEVSFVTRMGEEGGTIGQLAEALDLQWHEISRLIFLFKKTNVMDIWPAS